MKSKFGISFLYLIVTALVMFVASCETPYQRERVLRSVRLEYGVGVGTNERGNGSKEFDQESQWAAISIAPFAGYGGPDHVIVVATHAGADGETYDEVPR
jgi:hypothetical protein